MIDRSSVLLQQTFPRKRMTSKKTLFLVTGVGPGLEPAGRYSDRTHMRSFRGWLQAGWVCALFLYQPGASPSRAFLLPDVHRIRQGGIEPPNPKSAFGQMPSLRSFGQFRGDVRTGAGVDHGVSLDSKVRPLDRNCDGGSLPPRSSSAAQGTRMVDRPARWSTHSGCPLSFSAERNLEGETRIRLADGVSSRRFPSVPAL